MENNQEIQDPSTEGVGGLKGIKSIEQLRKEGLIKDTPQINNLEDYKKVYKSSLERAVPQEVGFVGINDSSFDEDITSMTQLNNLSNTRGEMQPWYDQITNGLVKGAVLAGTTFLDGTIGLAVGAGTALATGKASGLWNNEFSKAMDDINKLSENLMPNYYTDAEKEEPWYNHIFTANFLGDKFIKNLGFTVGAFYSGGLWTKALTATKLPQILGAVMKSSTAPAIISSATGVVTSAVNEGRIEALNNANQWEELEKAKLDDKHALTLQSLQQKYGDSEMLPQILEGANQAYEESLAELSVDKLKMGNATLLGNLPVLLASNMIQFGKLYANGYKTARKTANIVNKAGGYAVGNTGKNIGRALLNPLAEGSEEMGQRIAATVSGDYYEDKADNFYKAKIDPTAEQETLSFMKSMAQGINETVNDGSAWEEFFIGTLTGALGMPSFGKSNTTQAWVGKDKSFGISGGIMGELQSNAEQKEKDQKIVDYMNARVQDPKFVNYYQGLIRHNKYQGDMNAAVENGDEFEFKNAEHSQMVSDIMMFDNAGKLEDLLAIVDSSFDTSDANLQAIIDNTKSVIKDSEGKEKTISPFIDENGNSLISTPEGKQEMIDQLTKNRDDIKETIKDYVKVKDSIDMSTGQRLSDAQLEELTWLKTQVNNWDKRSTAIGKESAQYIQKISEGLGVHLERIKQEKLIESNAHETETEKFKTLEEQEKALTKRKTEVDSLLGVSDEIRGKILANKSINELFKDGAERAANEGALTNDENERFISNLNDLTKLDTVTKKYTDRLNAYLKNPDMLAENILKAEEDIKIDEAVKIAETMNVNNLADLKKQLGDIDESLRPYVLNELKKSQKYDTKKAVLNYDLILDAAKKFDTIFASLPKNDKYISANNIIGSFLESANDLPHFEEMVVQAITQKGLPAKVKKTLQEVLDTFNDANKSETTTKKDENPPKKGTRKKGSKKFSILNGPATIEEAENDMKRELSDPGSRTEEDDDSEIEDVIEEEPEEVVEPFVEKDLTKDDKDDYLTKEQYEEKPIVESRESQSNLEINVTPSIEDVEFEPSLRSWGNESRYNFNLLKDRVLRMKTLNSTDITDALDALGAYQFVDSGKLGKLFNKDLNKDDVDKLEIRYVLSKDKALKERILLAIEVTPEIIKTVGSLNNPITINNKQYQVIGSLGYNKRSEASEKNYYGIFDSLREERTKSKSKEQYFISKKFYNHLKHLYSGRMVKTDDKNSTVTKRPITQKFLNLGNDSQLHLGFYFDKGDFRTPTIDNENENIESLNLNNKNPRKGSVWFMTQEADGKWYSKAIQIKRFNSTEFNLTENIKTPVVERLNENIMKLLSLGTKFQDRLKARDEIERILYFPKNAEQKHGIIFREIKDKDGNIIDIKVTLKAADKANDLENITDSYQLITDKVIAMIDALQNENLDLRFQIRPSDMLDATRVKEILDSGLITTDLLEPLNVNASFDIYLNDIDSGEPIITSESSVGHTGYKGVNNDLTVQTVMFNGNKYRITKDGDIIDDNGELIDDQNLIIQIELSNKIANNIIQPDFNNVYVGVYQNGKKFGIKKSKGGTLKLMSDETFEKEFKAQKNKKKSQQRKTTQKEVAKVIDSTNVDDLPDSVFEDAREESMFSQTTTQPKSETTNPEELDDDFFADAREESMFGDTVKEEKVDEVVEKVIEKTTKKDKSIPKSPTAPKQNAPRISNDFTNTVIDTTPKANINPTAALRQYLRTNSEMKNKLLNKFGVLDLGQAFKNFNEKDLEVLSSLTTNAQLESFINNIIECR